MKKITRISWMVCAISLLIQTCSPTEVHVAISNKTYYVGDRIPIVLQVTPTGSIGGLFAIYERVNNTYLLVKRVYSTPSPSQCQTCSAIHDTPLRETLNETFYFIPTKPGKYNADANFDGVKDSVNFTVQENTTTTTTTTMTTTSTTASINTIETSSSSSSSSSRYKLIFTTDYSQPQPTSPSTSSSTTTLPTTTNPSTLETTTTTLENPKGFNYTCLDIAVIILIILLIGAVISTKALR